MAKDVELAYPDYSPSAPLMELSTDASQYGAGACLTQRQGDCDRVIAYASTTFSKAESKYSNIEQELAAIRWAVKVFRSFIYGVPFILYTDHRPLVYMSNMSQQNARITRTMNELTEYDFEIRHRPGKENRVADILSRLNPPLLPESETALTGHVGLPEGVSTLKVMESGGDSLVRSLWEVLQHHRGHYNPSLPVPPEDLALRRRLATELLERPETYGLKRDKATRNRLKMSRLSGYLPPEEFFLAFNNLYKLQVWVHHGLEKPIIYSVPGESAATDLECRVHLHCLAGIHYNPLVENRLY